MNNQFQILESDNISQIDPLKLKWLESLTSPQDGMWEILTGYAKHWEIKYQSQLIGYACVDNDNRLLQFFILPKWMHKGNEVFKYFIDQEKIKKALIGTNNPFCLSLAMHFQKSVKVHTYLFTDYSGIDDTALENQLIKTTEHDLPDLIDFYHTSMDGDKDWLSGYLRDLIEKGEVFMFKENAEILGSCEIRKSKTNSHVADLGMVVSSKHRKKGIGTFLLGKAKEIAISWDRKPICSCEWDNVGSLKSIQNNGFRSVHQMLVMEF